MTDRASPEAPAPLAGPAVPRPRVARALALAFLAAALLLGATKLELQRRSPPAWAAPPIHRFKGWVAIDGLAARAAWLRAELAPGAAAQTPRPDVALHATAWLVPLAVALASFVTGSIPLAFALLSGLASALQVLLVGRLARRLDPGRRAEVGWLAALAAAGHCLTMRTAAQLTLDPFCAAWTTAHLLVSLRWAERRRATDLAALVLLATSGLFLKSSFLPALAFPLLCALLHGERAPLRLLGLGALTALVPLALALLFQAFLLPHTGAADDLAHFARAWRLDPRQLRQFALEMALLFQLYPALLLRSRLVPGERPAATALGLFLASVWAFGLPAVPRLYLPALGFLVALCVPRLVAALGLRHARHVLAGAGLVNLALAVAGLVGSKP
jgi:hypothetical protein